MSVSDIRIGEVVENFINSKKAERLSPTTIKSYRSILNIFSTFIGKQKPFDNINVSDIRTYMGSLNALADKTAFNHYVCLSSFWTFATVEGIASDHLVGKIKKPRYTKRRIVPYTQAEVIRILSAARKPRDKAIIMTLVDCGIRASELAGLKVEDWNPGNLKVLGKGRKERIVPISEKTEKMILLQVKLGDPRGKGYSRPLFANLLTAGAINYSTLECLMARLEERSGVNDVHCHRFRHTFAINFLRNGGDIYTLKSILGHATLIMVENYLQIARSDIEQAHAKASPVVNWGL